MLCRQRGAVGGCRSWGGSQDVCERSHDGPDATAWRCTKCGYGHDKSLSTGRSSAPWLIMTLIAPHEASQATPRREVEDRHSRNKQRACQRNSPPDPRRSPINQPSARLQQMQPLLEEEVESLREQCDPPHHGQAEGGTEGHHQHENASSSGLPDSTLVLK